MEPENFFKSPQNVIHKQYEALRMYFLEKRSAQEVANHFGYEVNAIYALTYNFRKMLKTSNGVEKFFISPTVGRKPKTITDKTYKLIIALRKKYLSVPDIKTILDSLGLTVSDKHIFNVLKKEGFARLPRRSKLVKQEVMTSVNNFAAQKSEQLELLPESFYSQSNIGILCLLPYIQQYGINDLINSSAYPGTKTLPKINSILSFLALKLCNIRRYSSDDLWCMDRCLGLFAGLNVLPKTAWFTSYSHRITREMNMSFLKQMYKFWLEQGLISDTTNLDFVTIPYWGEDSHLENNWSGTRHKALASILAAVAQDPDTGLITYGDTTVRHNNESDVVVEFLDFYKQAGGQDLKYLVFDSKFTTYQNLSKLDDNDVKFITIRRRGKSLVERLNNLPANQWQKVRVPMANGRTRQIKIIDEIVFLKDYGKNIRQLSITGHGKIKPAIIITNDFDIIPEQIIRKYARRWLVEKTIAEQTHFFHLNKVSSSMVIKVDFDLTMTVLAYNIYRLFAQDFPGYTHNTAAILYEKFIYNGGTVQIDDQHIIINLKKKRNLPAVLTAMQQFQSCKIPWLKNKKLLFQAATYS